MKPPMLLLLLLPIGSQGELPSLTRVASAAAAAAAAAFCKEDGATDADNAGTSITEIRRQGGEGR